MALRALSLTLVASFSLAGCGNPCVSLCEDAKECPEADVATNCEQACESVKEGVESLDCLSLYEDAVGCQAGFDDVCAPDESCDEDVAAYLECVAEACAADPDNTFCG
jgi:hypothetical protein